MKPFQYYVSCASGLSMLLNESQFEAGFNSLTEAKEWADKRSKINNPGNFFAVVKHDAYTNQYTIISTLAKWS